MKKLMMIVVVFAVLLGAGYWYWESRAGTRTVFRFDEAAKGRLVATIGSTGTVQAQDVVDVGAQVAGRIMYIGKDPKTKSGIVDWGSEVHGPVYDKNGTLIEEGTLLAQIDPAIYQAQVKAADAAVKSAKADLLQKTAVRTQAKADFERVTKLYTENGIAKQEFDQYQATYEVAKANVDVGLANIDVAEANLANAKTNLTYTKIMPIIEGKGVVIDRRVNVGQTVVASLSAPSLFLIAKDLTKLEIWATVNEVDVSKIFEDQDVQFTVDSLPGRIYKGKVVNQGTLAFRLNATMNQNVVTYTVVVSVNNEDRMLKPYMTTTLTFIIADKKDAFMVPNSALRWQPTKEQIAPELLDSYFQLKTKKRAPTDTEERGFVWQQSDDGFVRYAELQLGLSDGVRTEVLRVIAGELAENSKIIIGEGKAGARSSSTNPFSVQMFKAAAKKE
jgi:HlyD family secretion protein